MSSGLSPYHSIKMLYFHRITLTCKKMLNQTVLFSLQNWHGGLPRCDAAAAGCVMAAGLKALPGELQTHEAELHLAAWTHDVLAGLLVVLQLHATGGAGPDGRAGPHPLHIGQRDGATPFQQLQILV